MSNGTAKELFEAGLDRFGKGEMLSALPFFEKSFSLDPSDGVCLSYMALLIGLERGQLQKAIAMAREAVVRSPGMPVLYVNLGQLYYKAERNGEAMEALRQSLKDGIIPEALELLNKINPRMKPLFSSLARCHFLNRWTGKLLKKTGLRRLRMPRRA